MENALTQEKQENIFAFHKEDRRFKAGMAAFLSLGPTGLVYADLLAMNAMPGIPLWLATVLSIGIATGRFTALSNKRDFQDILMYKMGIENKQDWAQVLHELENNPYVEVSRYGIRALSSLTEARSGTDVYTMTKTGTYQIELPPAEDTWDRNLDILTEVYGLSQRNNKNHWNLVRH